MMSEILACVNHKYVNKTMLTLIGSDLWVLISGILSIRFKFYLDTLCTSSYPKGKMCENCLTPSSSVSVIQIILLYNGEHRSVVPVYFAIELNFTSFCWSNSVGLFVCYCFCFLLQCSIFKSWWFQSFNIRSFYKVASHCCAVMDVLGRREGEILPFALSY